MRHEDYVAAEAFFKVAVALSPQEAQTHLHLAVALSSRNKLDESVEEARIAFDLDSTLFSAQQLLTGVLQRQGKFSEAIEAAKSAIEIDSRKVRPYFDLVRARKIRKTQEDDTIIHRLQQMVDEQSRTVGERIGLHYALGKAFDDRQEFSNAIFHFDLANELSYRTLVEHLSYNPPTEDRAVNNLIEFFDGDFFERHGSLGSASELPVLIVGMIRSGTTLLNTILSSHPKISTAGELPFWEVEGVPTLLKTIDRSIPKEKLDRLAREYRQILRSVGFASKRVIDKMPMNYQFIGLVHTVFPNARFIHIKRHPVDTCVSIYTTQYDMPPNFVYSKSHIVHNYRNYLRLMDHWRKVIPASRLIEVDYEKIVSDRESVLRPLMDFIGLEWDDSVLHHEKNRAELSTPSIWQARQPVYRSSVERWKNYEPWLGEFRDLL